VSAEATFDSISARLLPEVTAGTGFGSRPGLRVGGKIYAILVEEALAFVQGSR
jgi:hypothetical protein